MTPETAMGMIIAMFSIGVFLWRVIIYFWNKNKCFNDTMTTNKQLVRSMETMETQIQKVEAGLDELKDEIKDDFYQERSDGGKVHKEIFERLNNIDKNIAFISGQGSVNGNEV